MVSRRIGALIIRDKEILLVKGSENSNYFTPGGKSEAGETHRQTLKRELMEELSVNLTGMKRFQLITQIDKNNKKKRSYFYLADYLGDIKINNEIIDAKWLTAQDILTGKVQVSETARQRILVLVEKGLL